jgi:uncharacterized repeat protein (TIGR03803 family)
LTPPAVAGGSWTETTLYEFSGGKHGKNPASITIGACSQYCDLFGIAGGDTNGLVFRLSPPATSGAPWKEEVIHSFENDKDGEGPRDLLFEGDRIYGTTFRTVYRLKRPLASGGVWTERVLYHFGEAKHGEGPSGAVRLWRGALYGTTVAGGETNNGTIFQLTP